MKAGWPTCLIYSSSSLQQEQYPNGHIITSSSDPSPSSSSSSMGMVYADIGSLSLSSSSSMAPTTKTWPNNNASPPTFPFIREQHLNTTTTTTNHDHDHHHALDGKASDSSNTDDHHHIQQNPSENSVKESDSGQSKLCARGHWRPAEDSKLKELVALYGPQNWNLIAEKLEGRSGKFYNFSKF